MGNVEATASGDNSEEARKIDENIDNSLRDYNDKSLKSLLRNAKRTIVIGIGEVGIGAAVIALEEKMGWIWFGGIPMALGIGAVSYGVSRYRKAKRIEKGIDSEPPYDVFRALTRKH